MATALDKRAPAAAADVQLLAIASLAIGDDFRLDDDLEQLKELSASIARHGVLSPLLVRPATGGGWEVVAGRRRLAAARLAGLDVVPCAVRTLSEDEAADAALAENMHRRDLSPIEIAWALDRLRKQGLLQKQIAARVGRSSYYVSVVLRLLELPAEVRDKVHTGKMSYTTAYDLWKRKSTGRRQGTDARRGYSESESVIASHWRRRHDRLLAGLHALLKARPDDVPQFRMMVDRLIKLDVVPLEEPSTRSG